MYKCLTCGATTNDPKHSMIKYFHKDCKGKK
jgi:DNA-directed RNA polymerase subunit RPC12/RpoP